MLTTKTLPLKDLAPYYRNPRVGNVDAIAESLKVHGQYRAIVVNEGTQTGRRMEILAGNHTAQAARKLKWADIDAHVIDVDDVQAAKIVAVDNRTNDIAEYDKEALLALLTDLPDLEGTGYRLDDLDTLRDALDSEVPEFGEDEDAQGTLDATQPKECPSCHYQWKVGFNGEIVSV